VDDRVRAAGQPELFVAPFGPLRAFVLAVPDLDRPLVQRVRGVFGVEVELDHLPVAFVLVVVVVEGVKAPVLERELPRVPGIRDDVCVHGRVRATGDPIDPMLVVAPRVERPSGEVEVVLVEPPAEVGGGRRDLDEIRCASRPAERNRLLAEDRITSIGS